MTTKHRDAPLIAVLLVATATACFAWGMSRPVLTCAAPKVYVFGHTEQGHRPPVASINATLERIIPHEARP